MRSVREEMHNTGTMYHEAWLNGYAAIFTDSVPKDERDTGAVVQMHVSWKGKNPGVDVPLTVEAIAELRATLAKVARKAKRLHARAVARGA